MKETVPLEIKYAGPDVDDGSMSISDVVPALQGLASAYGKIAVEENLKVKHNIRVTGVRRGSFEILLEVCASPEAIDNAVLVGGLSFGAGLSAKIVIEKLVAVIKLTKHVNKNNFNTKVEGTDNISVTNSENVSITFPLNVYQIYTSGLIKSDIAKIAEPINPNKIDSATIKVDSQEEVITYADKTLFDTENVEVTKTQRMTLKGWLNSLTKTTNRGYFNLKDGSRVTYSLAVEEPESLYEFFIHKGPVEIDCEAHLDENLKPILLDIYDIAPLQSDLGLPDQNNNE
jgi:hypothetical protein